MNPLVSIIIPCYNLEKYITDCLLSVERQVYNELEVIIVDDGSTDDSVARVRAFLAEYADASEKKYIHVTQENGGASAARNAGLEICTGEYIAFIDGDDWVGETYIGDMVSAILEGDYDVCISGIHNYSEEKKCVVSQFGIEPQLLKSHEECYYGIDRLGFHFALLFGKIYAARTIKNPNIRLDTKLVVMEDLAFNMDVCRFVTSCVCIDSCQYYYRVNSESLSHRITLPSKYKRVYDHTRDYFGVMDSVQLEKYFDENPNFTKYLWRCAVSFPAQGEALDNQNARIRQILATPFVQNIIKTYRPEGMHEKILYTLIKYRQIFLLKCVVFVKYKLLLKSKGLYNLIKRMTAKKK